jgi:hypothetical protein
MKKTAIVLLSIVALAVLMTGCDQLKEWQGNAAISGLAKYFDKTAGHYAGIKVSLVSSTIILKPNQIPLDVAPLTITTGNTGAFDFSDIAPGTYIVFAEDPQGEYQPANAVITVAQDQTVESEDLVLTKAVEHVVIFRNTSGEWSNTTAIGDILEDEVGMTEGTGENQYEYKTSTDMATYTPELGDLIIIGGDQSTSFYTAYTTNKATFDDFVDEGGSMYWIACDGGWQSGDFTSTLPGGVTWSDAYENYNDIVYFEHPITKNFPEQIYGNYASHGGFDNLDALVDNGTLTNLMTYVVEDTRGLPTYVEYRTGLGKMLATTAPLEYYVTNGPTTMPTGFEISYKDLFKLMLTRSIKYMMNLEVSEDLPVTAEALALGSKAFKAGRASH